MLWKFRTNKNSSMSFISSLLIAFMKMSRMKKRLSKRSLKELHESLSCPDPPASVKKICTTKKFGQNGTNGYWLNEENKKTGTLVYLHGGAYTYGPIDFQWE